MTDRDGRFVALQLTPGRYTVTFKLTGFATLVQENILLTVGQAAQVSPVMKVSGVAETVTVSGGVAHGGDRPHGVREHAQPDDDRARRRSSAASSRTC